MSMLPITRACKAPSRCLACFERISTGVNVVGQPSAAKSYYREGQGLANSKYASAESKREICTRSEG